MIPIRAERRLLGLATAAVLALSGCGGDDETEPAATTAPAAAQSTTEPAVSDTTEETTTDETTTEETTTEDREPDGEGESGEGGAGDEEEARTEVHLNGSRGKVRPTDIKVAPFIGIRVIIRSRDGHGYFVTFGNDGGLAQPRKSAEFRMDGLRTGESREGRFLVDGRVKGTMRITATNEPGP